jgi:hypothetical protein
MPELAPCLVWHQGNGTEMEGGEVCEVGTVDVACDVALDAPDDLALGLTRSWPGGGDDPLANRHARVSSRNDCEDGTHMPITGAGC